MCWECMIMYWKIKKQELSHVFKCLFKKTLSRDKVDHHSSLKINYVRILSGIGVGDKMFSHA